MQRDNNDDRGILAELEGISGKRPVDAETMVKNRIHRDHRLRRIIRHFPKSICD
jgi:hypothetical protein